MQFAPAIHPTLIRLVDELDDGTDSIAAIWRELGRRARLQMRLQPSYESVRRLVHAQRAWRRLVSSLRRTAILTAELLWNSRDGTRIVLDLFDAGDVDRSRELSRAPKPRAPA